ncbi:hypothetical protein Ccr2_gp071 [Caulobacter phage Ccr2]|nr:hypothetical protein Ccr10_gp072 [Caulobacter phage Ccr10]ARB13946.1 hypothetical protein Ccr2_gp071 [Caulobacter phage Ccr2]ARB14636.1 hypothetical protein Ccr29_gp079 [Caulobacter phage Ccr29]
MANQSYKLHDVIIAYVKASNPELGLLTAAPSPDGTGVVEPNSVFGYGRQPIVFGTTVRMTGVDAGKSSISNTVPIVFGPTVTDGWPTVTHWGVFDENGDLLDYGPLPATRTLPVGDSISFGVGAVQLRYA